MAIEQHFQVSLEAAALIVSVREYGQVRSLIQRILDAAQNGRAKRINDVEDHYAHGVVALAA